MTPAVRWLLVVVVALLVLVPTAVVHLLPAKGSPIGDPWTGSMCRTAVGASTSAATTSTRSQRTAGVMEAKVRRRS